MYQRIVHFQDTDAAGVVYFANVLTFCHEAYEASLIEAGFDLKAFFRHADWALPIVHAQVDFFRPLYCGDRLQIQLLPQSLTENQFELAYQITLATETPLRCQALTRHVCIDPTTRKRSNLPAEIQQWLAQLCPPG